MASKTKETENTENRLVVASGSDGEWSEEVRGSGWGRNRESKGIYFRL